MKESQSGKWVFVCVFQYYKSGLKISWIDWYLIKKRKIKDVAWFKIKVCLWKCFLDFCYLNVFVVFWLIIKLKLKLTERENKAQVTHGSVGSPRETFNTF